MSLKAKNHINTIFNVWVVTPHFGRLMLMHGMTSALLADHLPPLPFLLSHNNWLLNLTILTLTKGLASPPLPHHPCHITSLGFCTLLHDLRNLPLLHSHTALSCSQFTILTPTQ
ncbi:hypothetical protein O181_004815 [Austropuccinia psidii MF-1]|uniref:Uncharacterized protein n=1 Tax=Austropuccinia psidii MF-1 TaxID=1389203 RepID=A0A9Q3GF83_9BASI|nr:hypothetical protein [Austropuccinia psidii MF-1]